MTIPEDIIIDVPSIALTVGVFIITKYSPLLTIVEPFMLYDTLERIITYPHTNTIKSEVKMNKVPDVQKTDEKMVYQIKNDIEFKTRSLALDCSIIVGGLLKWKEAFMTVSMDNIVITKCGIEVLNIKYKLKGFNRSIVIDIVKYKEELLTKRMCLSYGLTAITAIIVSSRYIRSLL